MRLETTHDPINVNGQPTGYILRILSPYLNHHVHVSIIHEAVSGSIVQAVGRSKEDATSFLWDVVQAEADRVRRSKLPIDNAEHILALEALLHDRQRYEAEAVQFKAFVAEGYRKMAQCGYWRYLFREPGQCELLMMHAAISGSVPCFELPSVQCENGKRPSVCANHP